MHYREKFMPEPNDHREKDDGSVKSGVERRGADRFPCDLKPSWRILGKQSGESWGGSIHDISKTGLSLRVRCWIKPGTVLVVRLHGRGERYSRPLPLRVMHATAGGDGEWIVGGMFVRPLNDEEIRQISEPE
jgi:hypothetical protein